MPDLSGPWDGSTFGQAQWLRDRGPLEPSGVVGPPSFTPGGGELGLTAAGFALSLALGRAHVRGAAYERTGTAWTDTVPANTHATYQRIDRLVLRRNAVAKTVTPVRLQGTAAASPVPPALTQVEDGTWDMPLFRWVAPPASGTPLVITDEREWLDDRDVLFRARRGAAQFLGSATWTAIAWDVEDLDTHGSFTPGGVDWVCPRTGYYRIACGLTFAGTPTGKAALRVARNGAAVGIGRTAANGGVSEPGIEASGLFLAFVGDLMKVEMYQDTGGTWNTTSPDHGPTFVDIEWKRGVW